MTDVTLTRKYNGKRPGEVLTNLSEVEADALVAIGLATRSEEAVKVEEAPSTVAHLDPPAGADQAIHDESVAEFNRLQPEAEVSDNGQV